ncbi:MAG TPA: (Fe-S)-binding protein [Solirubrobacteraceae bacterium]
MVDISTPAPRGVRAGILPVDEDELVACVGCGLCLPHCPTYRVTGLEQLSPRGRIAAMRAVELDGAPFDDAFRFTIETCVQCRGCEAACPSTVQFGHLVEGANEALASAPTSPDGTHRARRARRAPRRVAEWVGFTLVLPRHRLLLAGTWVLLVAQRLHLVPGQFGLPRLSARSLRAPLDADAPPADAYLFPGCVMDAWQRDVHRAAVTVMRAAGARVGLPGPGGDCCGALHSHAGRIGQARKLARLVMASMPGDAPVVVDSAGCGAAMKDYGRLVGTPAAHAFAARVRDFSEWVAEQPPLALRDLDQAVVVQDPCHLRHVQRAQNAVRTVLSPAYRLRETADDGLCCGAGGAYAVRERELAGQIRDRKVAAIRFAAGDGTRRVVVVSANPGCAMHLGAAGLDVRHPAELLAQALTRTEPERRDA